jgi:hypothetical protein
MSPNRSPCRKLPRLAHRRLLLTRQHRPPQQSERSPRRGRTRAAHQLSLRKLCEAKRIERINAMPFTVSYNGNGNGSDSGPVPSDLHGPSTLGETVLIPTVMPMSLGKTGTAFAYWNTEPGGSGIIHGWPTDTSFVMPASNIVLYAQWFVTAGLSAGGLTAHYAAAPRRRIHVAVPGAVRGRQGPNGGAPTATSWPTAPSGTGKHSQRSHNLHRPRWPGSRESPSDLSVRRTSRSVRRGRSDTRQPQMAHNDSSLFVVSRAGEGGGFAARCFFGCRAGYGAVPPV